VTKGTANKTLLAPGLSPNKSANQTYERILDASVLNKTQKSTNIERDRSAKYSRNRRSSAHRVENRENIP
jgi:hypothetical protein